MKRVNQLKAMTIAFDCFRIKIKRFIAIYLTIWNITFIRMGLRMGKEFCILEHGNWISILIISTVHISTSCNAYKNIKRIMHTLGQVELTKSN